MDNNSTPHYELVQVEKLGSEVIHVVVRDRNNRRAFVGIIREVNNPENYFEGKENE